MSPARVGLRLAFIAALGGCLLAIVAGCLVACGHGSPDVSPSSANGPSSAPGEDRDQGAATGNNNGTQASPPSGPTSVGSSGDSSEASGAGAAPGGPPSAGSSPAGASSAGPAGPASPGAPSTQPGAAPLVAYTRSGGFAGFQDSLTVQSDGKAVVSRRGGSREIHLDPARLSKLEDALKSARIDALPSESTARGADLFSYSLTYAGRTITFMDTAVPPSLEAVVPLLNGIVDDAMAPR